MKDKLTLPKLTPMDIVLSGLRPDNDWYEKKKLDERNEERKEKVMKIIRRDENGNSTSKEK